MRLYLRKILILCVVLVFLWFVVSLVDEFPVKKTSNKYADQLESKIMQLERKLDNQLVESGKLLERVKDHLKNKQDSASKQLENNMAFVEVSQDCDHEPTYQVIESFTQDDPTITVVKQPDQSVIPLERAKVKFRGYYNIARHYKAGGGGAAGAAAPDGLLPRPRLDAAPRHVGLAARALARRVGVSKGLFFDLHLRYMQLNMEYVEFTKLNLTYLLKATADEVMAGQGGEGAVRVPYSTAKTYQRAAKRLGLMEDFRSGIPRTAYRGIVQCYVRGRRVYLAPDFLWTRYDPAWG
ncbi:hypothetical protein MSG28_015021 [Choristoneura fumiferana]|uniref:Uncharacterized protein n=1 Tax=Choristoneura fumiferana TaxID=7141 RepID=A0ACC0KXY0_CHOFU|nr:hypothetical protein MSG28_015021 [Choristoneura fumiferana]